MDRPVRRGAGWRGAGASSWLVTCPQVRVGKSEAPQQSGRRMMFADHRPDQADLARFRALCGDRRWTVRLAEISRRAATSSLAGRAAQQRHALELALGRLLDAKAPEKATQAERRVAAYAREAVQLAATLPAAPRKRLREQIEAGLTGEATLVPCSTCFTPPPCTAPAASRCDFTGLAEGTPWDLLITREGTAAEVACETVSAEEGRPGPPRRLGCAGRPHQSRAADLARLASRPLPAEDDAARAAWRPTPRSPSCTAASARCCPSRSARTAAPRRC